MARVDGTTGDDDIRGTVQDDKIYGYRGNDHIEGLAGDDFIYGGAGDDFIRGFRGSDILRGEAGDDLLNGGGDADKIIGGFGSDTLIGGADADGFHFFSTGESTPEDPDVIRDFDSDNQGGDDDRIVLKEIDADVIEAGDQSFTFIKTQPFTGEAGELRFERQGQVVTVEGDTNGDEVADFAVVLLGNLHFDQKLSENDFIL